MKMSLEKRMGKLYFPKGFYPHVWWWKLFWFITKNGYFGLDHHWIQEPAAPSSSSLWDRDTLHWPRLLQAPSHLALNTSRDGEIQGWGITDHQRLFPSHRCPAQHHFLKGFHSCQEFCWRSSFPLVPKHSAMCVNPCHTGIWRPNGNFLGGRAAPGRKTQRGRCEGSSHCRGALCLLQHQSLIPTLVQHVLIFKNIHISCALYFSDSFSWMGSRGNPNCSNGAKRQELQVWPRAKFGGFLFKTQL